MTLAQAPRAPRSTLAIAALLLPLLLSTAHAARSTAVVSDPRYASAQRRVDIGNDRHLNIVCMGAGTPTVVFDAGLANWSQIWGLVQPAIARRTRACAYDRAGLGFSDAARRDGSSANIVDDLQRLLVAAGIKPPYVLVGHSYGGMSMRLYANLHREQVAGMVLVDPSTEDLAPPRTALPPAVAAQRAQERALAERNAQRCIAAAEAGFVAGSDTSKACVSEGSNRRYSAAINAVYGRLQRSAAFLKARWSEEVAFDASSADELSASTRTYDRMPLVVLTSYEAAMDPANGGYVRAHDAIAALSSRGSHRIVPESSHDIFFDQPQAVIGAIEEVLDAIARPDKSFRSSARSR
ncbi:MAG: alpha/beta hydrolase [Betaproteobacteria bacterium]